MNATTDDFLALLLNPRDVPAPAAIQLGQRIDGALYYRCNDCCAVFTTRAPIPPDAECECGGRRVDYIGKSKAGQLSREEIRSACDARCTNANGPNCDCLCAGANHGTGKLVTVEILSGIPRIRMNDPEAANRRVEFETECQEAKRRLAARYGIGTEDVTRRRWIANGALWRAICSTLDGIDAARSLKVHRNRIASLRKL